MRSLFKGELSIKDGKVKVGRTLANNPNFLRFVTANNLDFKPSNNFTKETIKERQSLYTQIAKLIWNVDNIKKYVN